MGRDRISDLPGNAVTAKPAYPCPCADVLGPASFIRAGSRLCAEGETVRHVWLIVHGVVKVTEPGNHDHVVKHFCADGAIVDALSVVRGDRYRSTAVAVTDCELYDIEASVFRGVRRTDSAAAAWFDLAIVQEAEHRAERIGLLGRRDAPDRLAWVIVDLFRTCHLALPDGGVRLAFRVQRQDLADCALLSPEHTSLVLGDLERAGFIRRAGRGVFELPNASPLLRRVHSG
jgi:CRP-like cAMP-binding protein